ncbi:hypothetical protein C7999DRAFT_38169 [Corynascus novoguineensis]|uniref:Uncharacterized protein n=1 Tax=Corynascus novoguineensis TaxID=1126955 RepID=A0AAN7HMS4_9PEZI|nr:hypothetical protein C7999DRAFT_38169 [Corynascus novoguineensis]
MSYLGAVQSALFYFLACTPCNQLHTEHELRQRQKKEKQMRERIVLDQPHLYRQPDPFHTNPYWDEEIRMGPSLPKKRKGSDGLSKSLSQRRLTAASRDGRPSIGTGSSVVVSLSELGSVASPRTSTSPVNAPGIGSTPTVMPEEYPASPALSKTVSISTSADWNFKRYQREDEELWGHEPTWSGHKLMDAIKQAGSSAGRYMESKLGLEKQVTDEDRYNFYSAPRNPPVNDYHPPVVSSKPAHKDALRWMLQPPPPAKVMEGKVPVTRSGSMLSATSRRTVSTRDGGSLGRLVGEKAVEAKIRRGEMPLDDELRPSPSLRKTRSRISTTARTRSWRTARTGNSSTDSEDDLADDFEKRIRTKRRVNYRPPDVDSETEDEGVYVSKSPESVSNTSLSSHAAQKPRLPTILSSGYDDKGSSEVDNSDLSSALRETTNSAPKLDTVKPNIPPVSSASLNMAMQA